MAGPGITASPCCFAAATSPCGKCMRICATTQRRRSSWWTALVKKPGSIPLFYPDIEARCKPRARLTITLKDFLVEQTGDQRWPSLVNSDRNLSRLILDHQDKAIDA